ncbi:phage tail sheath family protein [Halobacillus litoralis]|uniref:Phage tail sheath protein n=1 Tax=Halobacillus litoralis TaxID=45668 RepID=A0A410MCE3_9BACI|nr:phage tail sheath family protein [Halobacillus litoralis]QAS52377.1 phage tail sheath protein [Halobacillus litoralis]
MGRGEWSPGEDKTLAGAYMRFISAAKNTSSNGTRGIVAIPVKANWGPVGELVEITSEDELKNVYHTDFGGGFTAFKLISLMLLGNPNKVIGYRVADGSEAKASVKLQDGAAVDVLTLTTKHPTSLEFNVTIRDSLTEQGSQELILYEGTRKLFEVPFSDIDALVSAVNTSTRNEWLTATKDNDGTLASVTNEPLAGGNSGVASVTNEQYMDALTAFEAHRFDAFTLDGIVDADLRASVAEWTKRLRSQGKKITTFLGGSATDDETPSTGFNRSRSLDYEGIVNIGVSGEYDGVWYSSAEVASYFAGLVSGLPLRESVTFAVTPFTDVKPRLTYEQKKEAVTSGTIVMSYENGKVRCERGVNTLNTLRENQNDTWKKIKMVRVKDAIDMDTSSESIEKFIGKVPNNPDGQAYVLSALKNYFETLSPTLIAPDFTVEMDQERMATAGKDQFFWEYRVADIDTMEEIYGTGYHQ